MGDKKDISNVNKKEVIAHVELKADELNDTLLSILEDNFKSKSLLAASNNILKRLKKYYGIDYISVLTYNDNKLNVVATDVGTKYLEKLMEYMNRILNSMNNENYIVKVMVSNENVLRYPTASNRGIRFCAFIPLVLDGSLIGALVLEHRNAEDLDEDKVRFQLYDKILKCTSLVLQNMLYTEDLIAMVSLDQLTGVYNRRYLDIALEEQVEIHNNLDLVMGVSLLDIDFFKKFNDTYGHQFGDIVLKEISNHIKSMLGDNSWVARYGGEEFVVYFGRTDKTFVMNRLEEIRKSIEDLVLTDGEVEAKVTVSFGVAFNSKGLNAEQIVKRADNALYQSKENGRNRITLYSEA